MIQASWSNIENPFGSYFLSVFVYIMEVLTYNNPVEIKHLTQHQELNLFLSELNSFI